MGMQNLTAAQASLDLVLWDAEANSIASSDFYLWLRDCGLPSEVAIRLKSFVETTVEIANCTISIGKIILIKIIEFVKAHPSLAIGIAVGAAIGVLVSMIPFLGTYLAPIATALGITIGAIAGHRRDKLDKGASVNTDMSLISITQDLIEIAKEFFKLLIDIFNTVFNGQSLRGI
ncbi:DUF2273 domain-containing protein [Nitrosomonas sp. Nm58]|uniref:DUF2273 domain-containing protein n=1 Tax=Nitrosomonas sp. Nm58 TaxID=200126 RepID=UPI000894DDA5|nr:DUF2273 domain-containing protein [Nitrosomonas sp. Nm58]SDZ14259.1 Small integral membrane protein [Nitrosomonas sp. Nm58]